MAVQIPCPKCGAVLKLRDRSMLGRTGKCPKCEHRFTLSEPPPGPNEVELELADQPAKETIVRPAAARRVREDGPAQATPISTESTVPMVPVTPEIPVIVDPAAGTAGTERLRSRSHKRSRQRRTEIIVGGVVALTAVGVLWAGYRHFRSQPSLEPQVAIERPQQNVEYVSDRERLERMATLIAEDSPTDGQPISLDYVPAGASVVIHLHPAELWRQGSVGEEIRYCLGEDFQRWSEAQIEKYCLLPAAEIEKATICLILTSRSAPVEIATVVYPVTPLKTSELIQKFDGSAQDIDGVSVYVGSERSYVIGKELDDEKRPRFFATAPAALATDLAQSTYGPGITNDAIEELLAHTDDQRQISFVFRPADLRIHEETLAPADLRPTWSAMLDQFEDDTEAVAWSLHFDRRDLLSELSLRNVSTTTVPQFHRQMTQRLDALPEELVAAVTKMNPAEIGDRKLIGRLPAMVHLFASATVSGTSNRLVVLQTRLPERAGPNLALAGLLAWHESTRIDFTKQPVQPSVTPAPTAPLAERLKTPIEIDFRRTPLEDAFLYIGEETGVTFEIDGDALKLAGYTRNMPQEFALGKVPAEKALGTILARLDKLAIVLDDANNRAIVTSKSAAEEKGQTPATFNP